MSEFERLYSGPGRSGICVCGHKWEEHHLAVVMNPDYVKQTGEAYLPQECEAFGFNETGGSMCVQGEWVNHCRQYRDNKKTADQGT